MFFVLVKTNYHDFEPLNQSEDPNTKDVWVQMYPGVNTMAEAKCLIDKYSFPESDTMVFTDEFYDQGDGKDHFAYGVLTKEYSDKFNHCACVKETYQECVDSLAKENATAFIIKNTRTGV